MDTMAKGFCISILRKDYQSITLSVYGIAKDSSKDDIKNKIQSLAREICKIDNPKISIMPENWYNPISLDTYIETL